MIKIVCTECESDDILFDAWAKWDYEKQDYILVETYSNTFCNNCKGECEIKEIDSHE